MAPFRFLELMRINAGSRPRRGGWRPRPATPARLTQVEAQAGQARCLITMAMVVLSVHEHCAGRAAQKLHESVVPQACVVRDGRARPVAIAAMVPSYLAAVEGAQQFFYARLAGRARQRERSPAAP